VVRVLTVAKLSRWSVNYYNDTARAAGQATRDAQAAGGGLGEYYSEADTRAPVWLLAGDSTTAAGLVGLGDGQRAGGDADPEVVARWLDDGVAPSGECGRAVGERGVHGFDLTFCAPKSVSLLRAVRGDDVTQKAVANAHTAALSEAMEYLAAHAGYTRIHNPITGEKDLVKLPGLVAAAYQHETSRAGDPHLHTHVLVPNRQARGDGRLVSLDGTSLYHEARAAGIIYQATLRRELHQSLGVEWAPVDGQAGMADLAGIDPKSITAWSRRSTQLREWAANNLVIADGAGPTQGQLAAAQKATRPRKPEGMAWAELRQMWAADGRGFVIDETAQTAARAVRMAAAATMNPLGLAREAAARIDKAAFTRADLVEAIGAVLPVVIEGAPGTARTQIEVMVDRVGMRITAARTAAQREGHDRFTALEIIAEEADLLGLMGARNERATLPDTAVKTDGLSADQARAITNIAASPWLIQPLSAPAGAGKTTSLKALRAAAHRSGGERRVVVLAPTGQAVDVAVREGAGDSGMTVAKALRSLRDETWTIDSSTLIVVDEAGMVGTKDLQELLTATTPAGVKTVLVGDAHQLAPVKARGGMFAQLQSDLPWTQRLSEVWRMRDPEERAASLAVRDGGPAPLRRAVAWYRTHDRLHTGDPVAMAAGALSGWQADVATGRDALLIADTWEVADALNLRIHNDTVTADAPTVVGARGHRIAVGDVIISRRNDASVEVYDGTDVTTIAAPVRNGNRWQVYRVDPENHRIAARRIGDGARAMFSGNYLSEHVHHGFAVTVHAAQGATADSTHAVLGVSASRAAAYVAMTRGRTSNSVYLYEKIGGEGDHEHADTTPGVHAARRGTSHAAAKLLRTVLGRDERAQTVLATAADVERGQLPEPVRELLDQHDRTKASCRTQYRSHLTGRTVERELAAVLPGLRAGVALLEAAGGISGAGMYDTRADMFAEVAEPHRNAVAAVAQDIHAVQVLHVHPDAAEGKAAALAAITTAAREHQARWLVKSYNTSQPGVLALPATQQAADQAATQSYADTIRRPAAAVKNFDDGTWTLPTGSLVIVDDADHLDPGLLQSLVEQAATRTNTKLLLITNHGVDRSTDRGAQRINAVTTLQEHLPWARHIGTPEHRKAVRDSAISRAGHHLATVGDPESPVHAEVRDLVARHAHLAGGYRDEVTARDRYNADMARSLNRDRSLSRDDGLEL
jgi:conjugative relaxase-like TrwC/TraI family protein